MAQGIAITGAGIICSIGTDKASVLNSLLESRSGIGAIKHLPTSNRYLPAGEVDLDNHELMEVLGIQDDREISRTSLLGAIALRQAIRESSIEEFKGKKIALISGTTVGCLDLTERHYGGMLTDDVEASFAVNHDCGNSTVEIAKLCGLNCQCITISTACSSALNAIILGTRMLLNREADVVFAGGSEALSLFHLNGFNSLKILDTSLCRPFDATRRGLNLGEGAAYVCLRRSEDIGKGKPLGFVVGWGNRCDAFHQTATSDKGDGAYLAMRDALAMSGMEASKIDYINAHGTGTPDNDRSESVAIRRLFGDKIPPVSSTKTFTGHTTSASGSIETVICLLAMAHSFIPANLRFTHADPDCLLPSSGMVEHKIETVMCNSFGFGGNDSAVILSGYETFLKAEPARGSHIIAEAEITSIEGLDEVRRFVLPMEARRMGKLMKAALATSYSALEKAGVSSPDAIIIGTQYGMLEQGEKILTHLYQEGEDGISPTLFMQSTHNTIAGTLAIRLKCHGYNITYSQGSDSLCLAVEDAKRLIAEGKANTVLVGLHDYCSPLFRSFYKRALHEEPQELYSKSMVITKIDS